LLEKIETRERRQLSEECSGKEESFFFMDSSSSVPGNEVRWLANPSSRTRHLQSGRAFPLRKGYRSQGRSCYQVAQDFPGVTGLQNLDKGIEIKISKLNEVCGYIMAFSW
jgi:hypothetical protein